MWLERAQMIQRAKSKSLASVEFRGTCLQAATLADAADTSLALTRTLDTEDVDPAVLKAELDLYLKEIHSLFGEGTCLTAVGYTSTICEVLKRPIVFQAGKTLNMLGSSSGVKQETVKACLGRMRAWLKLAVW